MTKPRALPAYLHIKSEIVRWISSGKLRIGDPLPTRWELVETFGTSWGTLTRAINELMNEGVLRAERGKGTFVAGEPPARGRQPESRVLKVLICQPKWTVNRSLGSFMDGIREEAHKQQYAVEYLDRAPNEYAADDLEGYILITPTYEELPLLQERWRAGQRFVVLGSDFPGEPFPCINADTRNGTFQGVQHMIRQGHTAIALFGVQESFPNYQREIEGYRDAMYQAHLEIKPDWIVKREDDGAATVRAFERWLEEHPECTAIFSADYTSTMAILTVCERRGLSIPDDLSVVAMDELPSAEFLRTPLTSVVQPFEQLGRLAASSFFENNKELATTRLLPCNIHYRNSVRALNRA
jgi:GntR family transcriptional regulator of arabinose operon